MQHYTPHTNDKKSGLFGYLLLLTALFIFLEISYLIHRSDIYFGDFQLVADRITIPRTVYPDIFYFVLIQLSLHVLFTVIVWAMARLIGVALQYSWKKTEKMGFIFWFVGIFTILVANEYVFPNSKFAGLISCIIFPAIAKFLLIFLLAGIAIASVIALRGLFIVSSKALKFFLCILAMLVVIVGWNNLHPKKIAVRDAASIRKPNIILIGIDSLRPDFLAYFGHTEETPQIDHFLNQAAVFADALTPIARTFPSWVSILTGEYPKQSGVRFNLPEFNDPHWRFSWQSTLPAILRRQGYETIFATDEVRFSNIDTRFGFDKIVTPPVGVNDFLLGSVNDFPMSNLLVNTWMGKILFPHSYGNRPAFSTYDPDSFLKLLQPTLAELRDKPLFFAVHFCLPHFPYFWGTQRLEDKSIDNYRAAVQRVDKQFNDLLTLLKQDNLLEHSVVVLLSDHGEAIELAGDRVTEADLFIPGASNKKHVIPHFYPPSFDFETVNQSAGHGTDILGLTQYHTVLAFRFFGLNKNQVTPIPDQVSLLDIKPTLLHLLQIPAQPTDDGYSRMNLILGEKSVVHSPKDFFMETDFSPQAIRTVHPETHELLFEGIDFFQIDPKTTRLTVKKDMGDLIISSKQYADMYGDWILALYPQNKLNMTPVLVNLTTGKWTDDLDTSFAKASPVNHMLHELKQFYGKDITQIKNIPS